MKTLAAASIGQYEKAVLSLGDYNRAVELGLGACFREADLASTLIDPSDDARGPIAAIIFGSDQGLVGQFNEVVADHAVNTLSSMSGAVDVWAVGARLNERCADSGLSVENVYTLPSSVQAITQLVDQIQIGVEKRHYGRVFVFHNRPMKGSLYEPVDQRLLPLDSQWIRDLAKVAWPTKAFPEIMGSRIATVSALVREYLFISLFRACAESLASENSSRLAAMERADTNIADLLETLKVKANRLRQSLIDEELFDVISGSLL